MSNGIHSTPALQPILLCGASCRAAAWSARRAGLLPEAVDLFNDSDLQSVCLRTRRMTRYPAELPELLAGLTPAAPWMYTGGLENFPRLVDRISRDRPLWGNSGDVLRHVRDPWRVERLLREAGLPVLEVYSRAASPRPGSGWLRKPLAGTAGQHICHWTEAAAAAESSQPVRQAFHFQRFQPGTPHSLLFLAGWPHAEAAAVLGVTRQLMETDAPFHTPDIASHSPEAAFQYAGSLGPVQLPSPCLASLQQTATLLTRACGLRGLCGLDFMLDDAGTAWPVEINPRYPASAEVLELALQLPLLQRHAACFLPADQYSIQEAASSLPRADFPPTGPVTGKLIVRSPRTLHMDSRLLATLRDRYPAEPPVTPNYSHLPGVWLADIPPPQAAVSRGKPFCTLLTTGHSLIHCHQSLLRETAALHRLLRDGVPQTG